MLSEDSTRPLDQCQQRREPTLESRAEGSVRYAAGATLTEEDIEAMIQLHRVAFPDFFLTSLGSRFLRLLYSGFANADSGVCVLAKSGRKLIGFAVGTTAPEAFFGTLVRRQGIMFALAALPGLLHNPLFAIRKCLGALFYRGERPRALSGAGLLSSLAVSPEMTRKGIGSQLVHAFCCELRRRGVNSVYLTTDAANNDRVNQFYEKCGFQLVDVLERPGRRRINRWAKDLAQAPDG